MRRHRDRRKPVGDAAGVEDSDARLHVGGLWQDRQTTLVGDQSVRPGHLDHPAGGHGGEVRLQRNDGATRVQHHQGAYEGCHALARQHSHRTGRTIRQEGTRPAQSSVVHLAIGDDIRSDLYGGTIRGQ